jgi:hypothetical protein
MKRAWFVTLFASLLFLFIAFLLLILVGHYLNDNFAHLPPLPDLGHKVLPRIDILFLFQIGIWTSIILYILGSLNELPRTPYLFFMAGFWFIIRIASALVTPLGVPADIFIVVPENFSVKTIWDFIANGLDSPSVLFFSGHTGLPFLGYLLFKKSLKVKWFSLAMLPASAAYLFNFKDYPYWVGLVVALLWLIIWWKRDKFASLRFLCFVWSWVMAVTVLLTRMHYTIDVLGAYFMTAGIVLIGRYLFKKVELLCEWNKRFGS